MNKKFLQSVTTGIAALTLIASCSHFGMKKETNVCGAENGCASATKKDEAHKCSAKKDEANKCAAKKDEANKCAAKKSKKHKKSAAKVETKAEKETKAE